MCEVRGVDTASVQKIGEQVFGKNQRVVVYCVPGKKVTDDVPRSPEDTDANVKVVPPYTPEFETAQNWRKEVPKAGRSRPCICPRRRHLP